MSNWYDNYLTVLGPTADRASFKEKAVGIYPDDEPPQRKEILCFENFMPTPAALLQPGQSEACKDWRIENWEAVYGAVNSELKSEGEDRLGYYFETKWGPPLKFFRAIGLQWPTLTFRLRYEDCYGEVDGICQVSGDSIYMLERVHDLKKCPNPLTDEQFLAIAAELSQALGGEPTRFEFHSQRISASARCDEPISGTPPLESDNPLLQ